LKKSNKDRSGNKLGEYIREKRLAAGLTQTDVSKELGYKTAQFVSNWERGTSEAPFETLRIVAQIYSIPLEEMFEVTLKATIEKVTIDLKKKFKVPGQ